VATLILTAVGTAVGGPIGGAIGAFIGRQADSAIFGAGSREGPRLRELSVTTSSYGQPIPRHFGRMRVAGTIIWSTELTETRSKSGGGKGKPSTTTYSYSASFAVALSSTPIDRIGRIWADGNLLRGANGDLKVEGQMRSYLGTGDSPVDPIIAADRGFSAPAFRDCAYVVFEDLQLGDFGNRIPALTFEIFALEDTLVSLGQLVPESTSASGQILLHPVRGFSDEGGSLGSSLAAIDRVIPLNCITTRDGLSMSTTGTIPSNVPLVPEQLSSKDGESADKRFRQRGETIDREPLALRYYDEDRDYQPSIQRAIGSRPNGREIVIDLPAAMSAEGARKLANANAQRARWQNEKVVWHIGELDPQVGPGSIVRIPDMNGYWRIESWEWFDRGIELGLERLAPEVGAIIPSDSGTLNAPVDLAAPPTILLAIEVPPDGSSDASNPVMFAAASASNSGWRGAALFVEQGANLTEIGVTGAQRAVLGTLASALAGSASTLFEPTAALQIDIPAEDLFFESTDLTGLAMGSNRLLLGGEVVQFMSAEPISALRWKLSGLLRGRAGTEVAAEIGHVIGETAVLLDDRLSSLDPALVPSESGTNIAGLGRGDSEPVKAGLQNVGLSRRPPNPVHAQLDVLNDGSWRICWTRRARGQWTWSSANDVPLVEEQETYTVSFGSRELAQVAWTVSEPQLTLSLSDRAALVSEFGAGSLWVRQLGTFGPSNPLYLASLN